MPKIILIARGFLSLFVQATKLVDSIPGNTLETTSVRADSDCEHCVLCAVIRPNSSYLLSKSDGIIGQIPQ